MKRKKTEEINESRYAFDLLMFLTYKNGGKLVVSVEEFIAFLTTEPILQCDGDGTNITCQIVGAAGKGVEA